MEYIRADASNLDSVAYLAELLWHKDDFEDMEDLKSQLSMTLAGADGAFFLCLDGEVPAGFAQFSLRHDYVEGTEQRPVGYLEGVYVVEQYRRRGVAGRLTRMGETWAAENGCRQMASDCELTNADSLRFHLASGFSEANRIICFVKNIDAYINHSDTN